MPSLCLAFKASNLGLGRVSAAADTPSWLKLLCCLWLGLEETGAQKQSLGRLPLQPPRLPSSVPPMCGRQGPNALSIPPTPTLLKPSSRLSVAHIGNNGAERFRFLLHP
jgi:hypothetical protein